MAVNQAPRVLFVLKYREDTWGGDYSGNDYGGYSDTPTTATTADPKKALSSGLLNSASFMSDMLLANGIEAKLVQVLDNNGIDREVKAYQPTHVVIEALWVVPEKFDVLTKLHPQVKWIIRNHSELPFVANEGIAMEWLLAYAGKPNVRISNNAPRAQNEMRFLVSQAYPNLGDLLDTKVVYLPNYYPLPDAPIDVSLFVPKVPGDVFNVGCFGAIRPLKNHLLQAVAALKFCDDMGFKLRFHINGTRVEGGASPILKNLRKMFEKLGDRAELVEHRWMTHDIFLDVVTQMDMGLQVSFSETFNIVGADLVAGGVPVVGTSEIPWLPNAFCADPTDSEDIVQKMKTAYFFPQSNGYFNLWRYNLDRYIARSEACWLGYFQNN